MSLIADKAVKVFDLEAIRRGDCVRIRRTGDTTFKNGFVTKATEQTVEILYCNTQNNATSYLQVSAVDVAVGVWEIFWTADFQAINYENNAGGHRKTAVGACGRNLLHQPGTGDRMRDLEPLGRFCI